MWHIRKITLKLWKNNRLKFSNQIKHSIHLSTNNSNNSKINTETIQCLTLSALESFNKLQGIGKTPGLFCAENILQTESQDTTIGRKLTENPWIQYYKDQSYLNKNKP